MQAVGTYYYFFPTYAQAKKVLWDGRDREGFPFMGHFPPEIVAKRNETDLRVELINGSAVQLIGTDKIDSIMGTNPIGCVFSEYSLQNPMAWEYIRPILRENGGWAIFDYTPRGKNHGYKLYEMARQNPNWFAEILTVEDTKAISLQAIDEERADGMSEEMIQQEFYCSFEGVMTGSIFARQLQEVERSGRITGVPWQPDQGVDTWWDIGTSDLCAIWFTQNVGREVHVIDYYENNGPGVGIDHYTKYLQGLPYTYSSHNGPHDLNAHQFAANGKSTLEVAAALGIKFKVIDRTDKMAQLNAGRAFFRRCWFDREKTEKGRDALMSYHYEWDENRKTFKDKPHHDWSSNAADAWMQLSVGHKASPIVLERKPEIEILNYGGEASQSWLAA